MSGVMEIPRHRSSSVRRQLFMLAAVVSAMLSITGCGKRIPGPSTPTTTLYVENRGYFDVNVFVLRSPLTRGIRLGTVSGGSSKTFRIRMTDLQPGGLMMLQVRAISGRTTWTSPSLTVDIGTVARLDVVSTSSGDLSGSQLYRQ